MVEGVFDGVSSVDETVFKYSEIDLVYGVGIEGDGSEGVMCTVSGDMCGKIAASLYAILRDNYPS